MKTMITSFKPTLLAAAGLALAGSRTASVRKAISYPLVAFYLLACWGVPADAAPPLLTDYVGGEAGLVVIVDPASVESATQLARQSKYLVALLDEDPANVGAHNQALAGAKVYPTAQAHRWWTTDRLPFRTNSVNVVILPEGPTAALLAEAERVIAPGHGLVLVEQNGSWQERRKPRPQGMSTWYGFARDGGNSFYSPDTELQKVNSVQFFGGGDRLRKSHPYVADDRVVVEDSGRMEGRDAFTGLLRWRSGFSHINSAIGILTDTNFWWLGSGRDGNGLLQGVNRLSGAEMPSINLGPFVSFRGQDNDSMTRYYRVVSDGKVIYATGGYKQLTAYDAATGGMLWRKDFDFFVECVAVSNGRLVAQLSNTNNSPRETAFSWNTNIAEAVVGLDSATGNELWRNTECKDRPIHNLAIDGEKVVVCSFLFNGGKAGGDKPEDAAWYGPLQFLQVIERDSGETRFFRTDFKELTCSNSIQLVALSPGRVGVLKDNDLTQFDATDGRLIQQYRGPGYHLAYPAVSANHFWPGNAAVPLNDATVMDGGGFDLVFPSYGHRNAVANGMLYTPSRLQTVSSGQVLGSAMAFIQRGMGDYQSLALDDDRRLLIQGEADWAMPAAGDWPTLRGDFERSGWLSGRAPVPSQLVWQQRPTSQVDAAAVQLLKAGWEQDGFIPGIVSQPVVDGEHLLVVQPNEHRLICYDRKSGMEQWSQRFNGRIRAAPTLGGGIGYLGCDDGTVSAIDLKDGRVVWQFFLSPGVDMVLDNDQLTSLYPVPSAPVLLDGSLYVAAGRHTNLELGIVVWKLDPATGESRGHVVLDEQWLGPFQHLPQGPSLNGSTKGPNGRPGMQVNDIMQVWDGKPILGNVAIDPLTLAATQYQDPPTVQHIEPARGGILGGVRWIRPRDQYEPYRLSGVSVKASHTFTGDGMILNRQLNLFAITHSKGVKITLLNLGFNSDNDGPLRNAQAQNLPTDRMDPSLAVAGRGDLIYMAGRHWDNKLRLLVINRNDPTTAVANIPIDRLDTGEEFVPDGIAITNDMVYLVTNRGRILAFNSIDAPPTVATPAAAALASATTASISVLGADDGGEPGLTYTWTIVGTPPAPVSFSANGVNAAKAVTASFTQPGTYTFRATITDAGGLTAVSDAALTVPPSYALWVAGNGLSGAGAAFDTDSDGNGITNGEEYAMRLGGLPVARDGLPRMSIAEDPTVVPLSGEQYITLSFRRPVDITDVTYTVEISSDLQPAWLQGSSYAAPGDALENPHTKQVSRDETDGIETVIVRDKTPATSQPKRFIRLKITKAL